MSLNVSILKEHLSTKNTVKEKPFRISYPVAGLIVVTLCLLIISNPAIKRDFHVKYMENLQSFNGRSIVLVRDYLRVRHGQVRHYDYLESDLQNMEKAALLSAIVPAHVGQEIETAAKRLSEDYLSKLESIRNYVELSKRSIGLLRNSNAVLSELLAQLTDELPVDADSPIDSRVNVIALNIVNSINEGQELTQIHKHINDFAQFDNQSHDLLEQIKLHTGMVASYSKVLDEADAYIFEHADALNQPREISELYLNRHNMVQKRSVWQLRIIYFLVITLIVALVIHAFRKNLSSHKSEFEKVTAAAMANDSLHNSSKAA